MRQIRVVGRTKFSALEAISAGWVTFVVVTQVPRCD